MTDATRLLTDLVGTNGEARPLADAPDVATAKAPIVVVVGMHGAGTSIVASELAALGLLPPELGDPPAPRVIGPRALESRSLFEFDDRLLARLGGSWHRPPRLEPGWESTEALRELDGPAREAFRLAYSSESVPVLWNDPRLSLVLSYWRRLLERPMVAVLTLRSPISVARSLEEVDALPLVHGLALYERYLRSALSGIAGLPVFVCHHEEVTTNPAAFREAIVPFLSSQGIQAIETLGAAPAAANGRATNGTGKDPEAGLVLAELGELYDYVGALAGAHECFIAKAGPESPWTRSLLELSGDVDHLVDGLVWAVRQLEPLVRAQPLPVVADSGSRRVSDKAEQSDEELEADEDGPYPLSASEDRRAYHRWLRARRLPVVVGAPTDPPLRKARTRAPLRRREPLVSVLVPVWQTPLWALERGVGSVLGQSFGDWELCVCDDASGDVELNDYLKSLHKLDRRIRVTALKENAGISAATNAALKLARGRFVTFLDHDDELTPNALDEVARAIAAHPDVDVLYSDEDKIDASGERFDPLFKPDWSPDLLLSFAYLCHLTVIRRQLVDELGGLRSEFDGSQDYDLSLRATERAREIVHIPEILYHWRTLPGSAAGDSPGAIAKPWAYEAGKRAIEDALERRDERGEVRALEGFPGRYHVRRAVVGNPLVSIIVPFRDEPALLATCASSLRAAPGYDNIELVLVDNGSELPETEALLERLSTEDLVQVIRAPGPFNWAALNNQAARVAKGDMLLFANNDIEARIAGWLDAMLGHAQRPEVGAVGARLLYPDGAIQHAGVVIGLGGIAGHVLRGLPGEHPGYNSMAIQTRNCSVVTGACMLTRREVFEKVGGFDERLPVAFNDVDYCLKLREAGYLIVYTPLAELIHHESRSRGHTDDVAESNKIVQRWGAALAAGDPYTSVHLSHWRYWCPLSTAQEDDRWKTYLETSVLTPSSSSTT